MLTQREELPSDVMPITTTKLAEIFHVTVQSILKIIKINKDGLFTDIKIAKGKYDLYKFVYAYSQYQRNVGENSLTRRPKDLPEGVDIENSGELDIGYERARHYKAQADKIELSNKEKMGELLQTTDVQHFLLQLQRLYNTLLKAFEGRLSGIVSGAVNNEEERAYVLDTIKDEINSAANQTADALKTFAATIENGPDEPAASPDSTVEMGRAKPKTTT